MGCFDPMSSFLKGAFMFDPNFILLYVDSAERSARFYAQLFDRQPVEALPTFALFVFPTGLKLGLWNCADVQPAVARSATARGELAFPVQDDAALERWHADWARQGMPIAQPPTRMDFGLTFVALDPDGHRLRVFAPSQQA